MAKIRGNYSIDNKQNRLWDTFLDEEMELMPESARARSNHNEL